jgi:hypothetical protein
MVTSSIFDHAARLRSFEIIAEAAGRAFASVGVQTASVA